MTEHTRDAGSSPGLTHAFRTLPGWKITLLGVSLAVGAVGIAGQFVSNNLRHTAPVAATPPTHVAPGPASVRGVPGSSGFVSGGPTSPDQTPVPTPAPSAPPSPTLTDKMTPVMTGVGLSFFIGLVVGVVFRVFLKLGVTIAAVIVAISLALSYFHVINVDLSSVKVQSGQATSWLTEQASHLKDLLFAHLPSSTAAGAGFLFGMKRR